MVIVCLRMVFLLSVSDQIRQIGAKTRAAFVCGGNRWCGFRNAHTNGALATFYLQAKFNESSYPFCPRPWRHRFQGRVQTR